VAPIHNTWGLARILRGDVVGAVEQFDRARELDPTMFEAHMNSGAVNLSFRGYRAAEDAFRAALGLHPESYDAQVSLGAALRGLSRFDEARAAYEAARRLDPSRPDAYYNLGVLLQDYLMSEAGGMEEQIELLGQARAVYERFIEACEGDAERCVRRGLGGETEDMRGAARRRIDACEETADGLRQAMAPSST
jgi:Flp pilus assembly protein TadD